jgi:PAS domain S-box-containing protein
MNVKLTRVLLIEDNPGDARLIQEMLKEVGSGQYNFDYADRLSTGLEYMAKQNPDIILLDLGLPDSQGLDTLARVCALAVGIPIVVLTGLDDETVGLDAVHRGAQDYLVKGHILGKSETLQRVINFAIERKELHKALERSEWNLRNSLDNSPMGICIVNVDGEEVYANKVMLSLYGYNSLEELKVTPVKKRYTTESYAEHQMRKEKRQRGDYVASNYEVSIVRKDSEIRHLEVFRKEVLWNAHTQYLVLYNDITKRKKAEDALRESEGKHRTLFETMAQGVVYQNAEGQIISANPAAERILGLTLDQMQGRTSTDPRWKAIHEDSSDFPGDTHPAMVALITGKGVRNVIMGVFHPSENEYVWININAILQFNQGETKSHHVYTTFEDITERKKMEEEKQRLEEKAQMASRLAAVGEMAAGIAHEINNPLTGVLGFSKLLLEKENLPEELKDDIKLIADGSQRVADIVRRLLIFARQTKPIRTSVNLNELIDNTLKLRDYVLKTANIEVVTSFDPELPWSSIDPGQLQQVFMNLIVNAEQAMKKAHGRGNLTVTTEKKGKNIRISFADDGPGVTKENIKRLFQPFFTTKAPGEGTGLGLSLSRSIILEHGGEINVESEPGHGAQFIIEIPITEALPPKVDASSPVAKVRPTSTKKGRILVVDDEPGVRDLIEKTLTRTGHSVDTIADAREAAAKLTVGATYDVIFTDVRMPGMSGIELYAYILEKVPAMANRIVFITGDTMGADIKAFLTQNNLIYLSKPFDIEALKEKVDTILGAV